MPLNDITFIKGQGGLGRPLPTKDHVSGLVAYLTDANLPAGFSATDRIKKVFSIQEAEALGFAEGSATNGDIWYHINQYFVNQPQGELCIGLYDSTSVDYSVIETVQTFAEGEIRQIAVYDPGTTFATAQIATLNTSVNNLEAIHMPLHVIYAGDISATTDLTTLPDLRALTSNDVSVCIGQDGNAAGAALYTSKSYTISCIGALLGAVSFANVHEDVAWIEKFNMVKGAEFDVPAIGNGALYKSLSSGLVSSLNDKGYIFLRKHIGISGSYFNDSHTCIAVTSDFAYIENNRTIDKAIRQVRARLLPKIASPVITDPATGYLPEETIALFKNDADLALEQMLRDNELSGFQTIINPEQNVASTSKIVVNIELVPVGVARNIEVNIGFTVSLS